MLSVYGRLHQLEAIYASDVIAQVNRFIFSQLKLFSILFCTVFSSINALYNVLGQKKKSFTYIDVEIRLCVA